MRAWVIVVALVLIGIVGAWVGYWIGHAVGWTTGAEFPFKIGAGERAIGLSIGVSFLSVMAGLWWFVARPVRIVRRLLTTGAPGHATVGKVWRTGVSIGGWGDRHQLGFELEVHPDGRPDYAATAIGLMTEAEEATLKPGTEVNVRYDPSHPTSVAVIGPTAMPIG